MEDKNYTPLSPEMLPPEITKEEAAAYLGQGKGHGRIVKSIAKQVVSINKASKEAARAKIKRINLIKRSKKSLRSKAQKLDEFLEEFLKNGGNATQAAIKVGKYSSLDSASSAGYVYLKQAKSLARIYLEKKGYGYGKLLDKAAEKMDQSKTPEWWDRLMKLADYHDFISKEKGPQTAIVNVVQSHKDLASSYIEGEVEEVEPIEEENEETK